MSHNRVDVGPKGRHIKVSTNGAKSEGNTVATIAEPEEFTEMGVDAEKSHTTEIHHHLRHEHQGQVKKTHSNKDGSCVKQSKTCVKSCCIYMLSYLGLTCLVVAYSVLGGFVFVELEKYNEEKIQENAVQIRNQYADDIETSVRDFCTTASSGCDYNVTSPELNNAIRRILRNFQNETYHLVSKEGWAGVNDESENDSKWTFAGALLFSVTVITTIGT